MKFTIKYNPYTQECVFLKNNHEMSNKDSFVQKTQGKRLQTLMFPTGNWKGLAAEMAREANETKINVEFLGREIDYTDLEEHLREYNETNPRGQQFFLQRPTHFAADDQAMRKKLDGLVSSFYQNDNPIDELRTDNSLREDYEENMGDTFDMAVVGTMSSGKSTLINAMLGQDLLPSRCEATTAKVTRIFDDDNARGFEVQARTTEEAEVGCRLPANLDLLEKLNSDKNTFYVDIYGNIPGVSNDTLKLCLLDTPGVDNSATTEHYIITKSVVQDPSRQPLILYVINSAKPEEQSDADFMREIAEEIKKRGKEAQDRFIFVMNQADRIDEKESIEETVKKRQEYLKRNGIVSNQIIPLCAQAAKLLRMKKHGAVLSKKSSCSLATMLCSELDDAAILTPSCRRKLNEIKQNALTDLESKDAAVAERAQYTLDLIKTGIIGVELTIDEYLKKYAYPQKIYHATIRFRDKLAEKKMITSLEELLATNRDKETKFKEEMHRIEIDKKNLKSKKNGLEQKTMNLKIDPHTFDKFSRELRVEQDKMIQNIRSQAGSYGAGSSEAARVAFFQQVSGQESRLFEQMKAWSLERVQEKIEEDLTALIEDYTSAMHEIEETFSFDGFDMSQSADLKALHRDLDQLKVTGISYSKERYGMSHEDTVETPIDNPERQGFFGFFKFWKPKKVIYSKTIEIDDGINVEMMLADVIDQDKKNQAEMIDLLQKETERVYAQNRSKCIAQLNKFDAAINAQVAQLKSIEDKIAQNTVNYNEIKKKKEWLNGKANELDGILSMNEKGALA